MPKRSPKEGSRRRPEGDQPAREAFEPHFHARSDSGDAFMDDPGDGPAYIRDELAEVLAEEFLRSATTGEGTQDQALDQPVPEEIGGPFIETSAGEEFADGTDESNPEDATQEALPRAMGGLVENPRR